MRILHLFLERNTNLNLTIGMKVKLLFLISLITFINFAQNTKSVSIGNTDAAAYLDINQNNQGVIAPRIALESVYDSITVKNKKNQNLYTPESTFVWNTTTDITTISSNNTKLLPGLYVWKNKRWHRVLNGTTKVISETNGLNAPNFQDTNCSNWVEITANKTTPFIVKKNSIIEINFDFKNYQNSICEVELYVDFESRDFKPVEIFLISPTKEILELMHDNGPIIVGGDRKLKGYFRDASPRSITQWTNGNYNNTDFRPQGITTVPNYENHYTSGNITNLAGFINKNPIGKWYVIINNASSFDEVNVNDIKLRLKVKETYLMNANYKLVHQIPYNTKTAQTAIYNSNFNALIQSNVLHTVVTRTSTPLDPNLQPNNLNSLEVLNVNTTMNSGLSWLQLSNQVIDKNLVENTTYYYQLWYLGDVVNNQKQHTITINGITE